MICVFLKEETVYFVCWIILHVYLAYLFLLSADFFQNHLFQKSSLEYQTEIQDPDQVQYQVWSCKDYQQTTQE